MDREEFEKEIAFAKASQSVAESIEVESMEDINLQMAYHDATFDALLAAQEMLDKQNGTNLAQIMRDAKAKRA